MSLRDPMGARCSRPGIRVLQTLDQTQARVCARKREFRINVNIAVSWIKARLASKRLRVKNASNEPDSNTLCQVLTCPDCRSASSLQFLGASGRYILVNGPQDVLLWDLVSQTRTYLLNMAVRGS